MAFENTISLPVGDDLGTHVPFALLFADRNETQRGSTQAPRSLPELLSIRHENKRTGSPAYAVQRHVVSLHTSVRDTSGAVCVLKLNFSLEVPVFDVFTDALIQARTTMLFSVLAPITASDGLAPDLTKLQMLLRGES